MDADTYLSIPSIKRNEDFMMEKYRKEFNMTSKEVLEGFVSVKDWVVDLIEPDNMKILDISGHSLFSPLMVFKGRYKEYSMFYPGDQYYQINKSALNDLENKYQISYVNNYSKDYDLILDWNGEINFGENFNFDMFIILLQMFQHTKKWVIVQHKQFLKLDDTTIDMCSIFETMNYKIYSLLFPPWARHEGGYTFALKKEKI